MVYQIIRAVRALLSLYAVLQLLHFALPFITNAQRPWMTTLAKICEPGGGDLSLIAVEYHEVQGVRAAQPVLFHFFGRDLIPVSGNAKNIQSKMLESVIHDALLSAGGAATGGGE